MLRRRDPLLVLAICFVPLIGTAMYSVLRGDRVANYTTARVIVGVAFELAVGIGGLLYLRWRGMPMHPFRVKLSWSALFIGGLLGVLLIPVAGIVYNVAMHVPGFASFGVKEFRDTAPFALTMFFLVLNSWFEESFVLALPMAAFRDVPAWQLILGSSLLRASYHLYQGPAGLVAIFTFGLVVSSVYWRTRDLAIPIVAHTVMNVLLTAWRHGT